MSKFGCGCRSSCVGLAIVASIIVGIITAFLQFSAIITVAPAFLWVVLGISVVYLAIALITSTIVQGCEARECICSVLPALLTGILGGVLASLILLAVTFAATSAVGAIITGALVFFLSLTLTSTACLIKCVARCDE